MADIVKDATEYRIKQIELAEAQYYKSLINTLDRICLLYTSDAADD